MNAPVHDEVCGMDIDAESAADQAEFQGKTYYFCTERCRKMFEKHPDWYVPVRRGDGEDADVKGGDRP